MHAAAEQHLIEADRTLGHLIRRVGPCRLEAKSSGDAQGPFIALVEAVAHQQLTGKAAATILGRFRALFPAGRFPRPAQLLAVEEERLRAAGFSRAKIKALKDIAAKSIDGTVPSTKAIARLEDEAIIARLTTIHGVGRWTVEMLLIFHLGRPDVLPVDDYGVRKGFALTFRRPDLPTKAEILARGERWRPYRSVASWYLWRAVDLARASAS
ncbi:MAG TPA: DNA-3-methyladenine glycosylase [Methylomirabilota bacterium]|nr:DNA-3-methyladenine glycosylase [Methylomirabilota bacterium]